MIDILQALLRTRMDDDAVAVRSPTRAGRCMSVRC
jgi:hypothetical protein